MLHGGRKPPLDIQDDPRKFRVVPNGAHQEFMIQIVEETFDVQINYPISPPASLPRRPHRIQG